MPALTPTKREQCKHWREIEMMFVWWPRPQRFKVCVLMDERFPSAQNPPCWECEKWEERCPTKSR